MMVHCCLPCSKIVILDGTGTRKIAVWNLRMVGNRKTRSYEFLVNGQFIMFWNMPLRILQKVYERWLFSWCWTGDVSSLLNSPILCSSSSCFQKHKKSYRKKGCCNIIFRFACLDNVSFEKIDWVSRTFKANSNFVVAGFEVKDLRYLKAFSDCSAGQQCGWHCICFVLHFSWCFFRCGCISSDPGKPH